MNTPSLHCNWNSLKTLLSWTSTTASIQSPGHYSHLSTPPPLPSLSSEYSSSKNKPAQWFSLANKKKSKLLTEYKNKNIRFFMIQLRPTSSDSSFTDPSHMLMLEPHRDSHYKPWITAFMPLLMDYYLPRKLPSLLLPITPFHPSRPSANVSSFEKSFPTMSCSILHALANTFRDLLSLW